LLNNYKNLFLLCYNIFFIFPTDSNRSIATLAITTLLKTGAESSVDRLMKQIASFVSEISDEFKIVVVQAISALCTKFPKKHGILLNFLSGMLRQIPLHLCSVFRIRIRIHMFFGLPDPDPSIKQK
jgi:hypothetical protein